MNKKELVWFMALIIACLICGLLVPFQLSIRYLRLMQKFTTFDWIVFSCSILIPFFLLKYGKKTVSLVLLSLVGVGITSLLSYIFLPVMRFAGEYQPIIAIIGIPTQIGVFAFNLLLFFGLNLFGRLILWMQLLFRSKKMKLSRVSVLIGLGFIISTFFVTLILITVATSHAIFISAGLAASFGSIIISYYYFEIKATWKGMHSKDKSINKNRNKRLSFRMKVINSFTLPFTWISSLALIAGAMLVFKTALGDDRELVYMNHLYSSTLIGTIVCILVSLTINRNKYLKLSFTSISAISFAFLLLNMINGSFYTNSIRFTLVGLVIAPATWSFMLDTIQHGRKGAMGLLISISMMAGGVISGIIAKVEDFLPLVTIIMLSLLGVYLMEIISFTLRTEFNKVYLKKYQSRLDLDES